MAGCAVLAQNRAWQRIAPEPALDALKARIPRLSEEKRGDPIVCPRGDLNPHALYGH